MATPFTHAPASLGEGIDAREEGVMTAVHPAPRVRGRERGEGGEGERSRGGKDSCAKGRKPRKSFPFAY